MLVSPRPGVSRRNLLDALRQVHTAAHNLRGGGGPAPAQSQLGGYLEWATVTVQQLGGQISAADIDRLVLTRGYDRLLSIAGTMTGDDITTQRVLRGLVSLELTQRIDAFGAAVEALRAQTERWSRLGEFVVADTSFYIEHEDKLANADFRQLLKIREDPVHLLVPIVIVDELDGLKKSRDSHSRWRAAYTLAVLDRVFATSAGPAPLTPEDSSALGSGGIPHGEVTIELVFDPPGHVRLPISDDEIIDRIMAIQPLAAREVRLLTCDTGQSTRARAAGLNVSKLARPQEDEPATTARPGRNGKR